jgi:hypothetical protein
LKTPAISICYGVSPGFYKAKFATDFDLLGPLQLPTQRSAADYWTGLLASRAGTHQWPLPRRRSVDIRHERASQAGDLVNGGSVSGGCSGGRELFGEHSFSVRDQVPPKGAHDFRRSSAIAQNGACVGLNFRRGSGLPSSLIFPGSPGHRPPLRAVFVFLGVCSPNRRESPDVRFRLVRDSRQRALVSTRGSHEGVGGSLE